MSNINIEKGMEINADIKMGCIDVAKVVESMAKKCESVEVITEEILRPKVTIKGHSCKIE